jgi:pyruvate dehydrogenase E2 component (dihydrolipoamide acetyltransferase)
MPLDIKLTSFGASMEEAKLVQWLVSVGDKVTAGQAIAEVETDKALAELESPVDGIIESIEVENDTDGVEVGTVLARLATDAEEHSPEAPPEPPKSVEPAADQRPPASPRVRRLAQELGVDLSNVTGSGPGGRILAEDLEAPASNDAGYEVIPLTEMRRAIARRLTESVRDFPQFSLFVDLELDALFARREAHNAEAGSGSRASINDFFVWACSRALTDQPDVNASWSEKGILRHRHANIAVAVAIEGGLVTPVIQSAESKSVSEISAESRELANRAREKRLKNSDLEGGTFTVSNLGMSGIKSFTSILSPPQACILSVGAAEARAVVREGEVVIANMATVTLTCDHRVVDGAMGAAFLAALRERIEAD